MNYLNNATDFNKLYVYSNDVNLDNLSSNNTKLLNVNTILIGFVVMLVLLIVYQYFKSKEKAMEL
jgi:uncharacterized membrane protein